MSGGRAPQPFLLLSSSPHWLPVGSHVCRRACFWIEWLQSGTCLVLERIDFGHRRCPSAKKKKRVKNAFEMHSRLYGSIATLAPIIYQKFNVTMRLLISQYNYEIEHILEFFFPIFWTPRKLFLATHFQICFWKYEPCRWQLLLSNLASVVTLLT